MAIPCNLLRPRSLSIRRLTIVLQAPGRLPKGITLEQANLLGVVKAKKPRLEIALSDSTALALAVRVGCWERQSVGAYGAVAAWMFSMPPQLPGMQSAAQQRNPSCMQYASAVAAASAAADPVPAPPNTSGYMHALQGGGPSPAHARLLVAGLSATASPEEMQRALAAAGMEIYPPASLQDEFVENALAVMQAEVCMGGCVICWLGEWGPGEGGGMGSGSDGAVMLVGMHSFACGRAGCRLACCERVRRRAGCMWGAYQAGLCTRGCHCF